MSHLNYSLSECICHSSTVLVRVSEIVKCRPNVFPVHQASASRRVPQTGERRLPAVGGWPRENQGPGDETYGNNTAFVQVVVMMKIIGVVSFVDL